MASEQKKTPRKRQHEHFNIGLALATKEEIAGLSEDMFANGDMYNPLKHKEELLYAQPDAPLIFHLDLFIESPFKTGASLERLCSSTKMSITSDRDKAFDHRYKILVSEDLINRGCYRINFYSEDDQEDDQVQSSESGHQHIGYWFEAFYLKNDPFPEAGKPNDKVYVSSYVGMKLAIFKIERSKPKGPEECKCNC